MAPALPMPSPGMARSPIVYGLIGALALCSAAGSAGCAVARNPFEPQSPTADAATLAAAATVCVDQVNILRASVGDSPLARSSRIDAFSAEAARIDGEAHQAHKYFLATNGGNGVALAENVIPWWRVADYGSVDKIVRKGVTQMWNEGPSGYHYANMRGRYSEMGCGIAVLNGEVTVSQDFH
jgi:hypothetical protein